MNLSDYRREIDELDAKIVELIAQRQQIIPKITEYKMQHNLVIYQPKREKEQLAKMRQLAKTYRLNPDLIEEIFEKIISKASREIQGKILRQKQKISRLINFQQLKLRRKKLKIKLPIFEIFKNVYANFDNFFFLESLGKEEELSRYSYIGFDPLHHFQARGEHLWLNGKEIACKNPLRKIIKTIPHDLFGGEGFCGGLVGYLSYESLRYLENLPYFKENAEFYDFEFGLYLDGLIHNKQTNEIEYFYLSEDRSARIIESMRSKVELVPLTAKSVTPGLSDRQYQTNAQKIIREIQSGNIYQAVLANRYQLAINGASLAFYEKLRAINPSPFMYFIKFGEREVLGSSPELVTRVRKGRIETFPIAGTRKRGETIKEDQKLAKELLQDQKERAEHLMLVDMGRNDLGRVCEFDSIKVDQLMAVKKYSHVQHLVSKISGHLKKSVHLLDAVMTNMPMGTVCGAPRLEAIKILNELEPVARGPYGGAAGYLSFNNECMFTLMIRSLFINGKNAYGMAGAGIVYDSRPAKEAREVKEKMRCVLQALGI